MEITRQNYDENLDLIRSNLRTCNFIGFDAEFTGLLTGDEYSNCLFDSNEERYEKFRSSLEHTIITQVGITTFHYNRDGNSFDANTYTFHLCPQVFADVNQSFMLKASALDFLCKHNFDFNKFLYNGIRYLRISDSERLMEQIKNQNLLAHLTRRLEIDEEKALQNHCSQVSKWLAQKDGEDRLYLTVNNVMSQYILHRELRNRFGKILTAHSLIECNVVVFRDQSAVDTKIITDEALDHEIIVYLSGFQQIVKDIMQYKKPVVGHNMFMDILLMYNQFIGDMPRKYSKFKENFHQHFPLIYDTKYISNEMAMLLSKDKVWKTNTLSDLYAYFKDPKFKNILKSSPNVHVKTEFKEVNNFHEAGFDSFCTGYCFTRLSHWAACQDMQLDRTVVCSQQLAAVEKFANQVNIIRGSQHSVNLAGKDPSSKRPDVMYVEAIKGNIDIGHITTVFGKFGSIDVKKCSKKSALIAVASHMANKRILKTFKNDSEFRVTKYNYLKHTRMGKIALWSSALISGSLLIYFFKTQMPTFWKKRLL